MHLPDPPALAVLSGCPWAALKAVSLSKEPTPR